MTKSWIPSMALLAALPTLSVEAGEPPVADVVLGIHGGAGGPKGDSSPQMQQALRADLDRALAAGYARLQQADGSSLDAVEAAIRVLEDSPHFNAGKGAVFTHEGRVELDASIMEGKALRAGAVAAVTTLKNPIAAARAVMEKSSSVLLVGHGAEAFAATAGLEIVDPSYFRTERRWQEIEEVWKKEKEAAGAADKSSRREDADPAHTWGTVGAVAVDRHGNLAAGTSTGGRVNKMHGRLGDSPIIGAGTYADNATCAISATGHGEFFIRYVAAYDVAALMKYRGLAIADAAAEVIKIKLKQAGGEGGLIALDAKGNLAMPFNTQTMYRGYIQRDGTRKVMLSGQ